MSIFCLSTIDGKDLNAFSWFRSGYFTWIRDGAYFVFSFLILYFYKRPHIDFRFKSGILLHKE